MGNTLRDAASLVPETASAHLRKMVDVALRAGSLLLSASAHRGALRVEEKTAGDFVSQADRAAEKLIAELLERDFPGYGWQGEESGIIAAEESGLRWLVDPLDGTTNFLKGLPHWAVSIALCRGEDILCAVIHDPAKSETFAAEAGQGAFLNGHLIGVSSGVALGAALFATGVPAGGRITYLPDCLADLERLMPRCAGIRRNGAAALDLAYVAAGRLEGYWERNLGPWDVAAGILLVQEAGGQVVPLWSGKSVLSSGSFIASNGDLGPELRTLIGTRDQGASGK